MSDANVPADLSAQGQPTEENQNQGQPSAVPNGFQERINELTANFRESQRQVEQMSSQLAQSQQLQQELLLKLTERNAPAPEQVDVDPEQQKVMRHFMSPLEKQLADMAKRQEQFMAMTQAQLKSQQVQSIATQRNIPATVVEEANKVLLAWQSNPALASIARPEDALAFAMGQAALKGQSMAQVSQDQRQQFNGAGQGMMGHSAPSRTASRTRPANFDDLSPEQKVAILESEGVGDKAF